jgi:hypothetical protein
VRGLRNSGNKQRRGKIEAEKRIGKRDIMGRVNSRKTNETLLYTVEHCTLKVAVGELRM